MTCSLVTQLATRPKVVGVAVEAGSLSAELIASSGWFALSLLSRADRNIVRRFVKPAVEDPEDHRLSGEQFTDAPVSGAPLLERALAYVDCRLYETVDFGSHKLFAGEVHAAGFGNKAGSEDDDVLRMEDTRMNYGG
jgi:flavin reductase (DIM6/NTAB) family NADH-FMN oxidoreductase RutF